ncbi:hypothetical protein CLOP_g24956 [Closterium sp. NIES-67]|nr:hypothetical protein CLOP_g24956 [Closterium sp. NIES-67]
MDRVSKSTIRDVVFRGPIFGVLLALWLLSGVSIAAWLCYSRHSSYQTDRRQHLDTWCYERAMLFEQHTLTTVSQIRTFAGLASVMGKPKMGGGNWTWDKCFTSQRWDAYVNKTGYSRPGNTGALLCLFVTDKERPAFERQYGGPIRDLAGMPQQHHPFYCVKTIDIHYYRSSIPLVDLVPRISSELAFLRRTGEVGYSGVTPIGNLSYNLTGVAVGFPILQYPLPPSPTEQQLEDDVIGTAGAVVDMTSIAKNVLQKVFSPDPSIAFEVYDTTDPNALTMIYGPGPRLIYYKENDKAPFTAVSPENITRPWEERAVVPMELLGGRLRQYAVWCRYAEPASAWNSWGVPFLWLLLALAMTALIAAVAWQQRMGYLRSQEGIATADRLRANARAAEQSKSSFVASMSHELRTPMIGIVGMLDALADMGLSASQVEDVSAARASAHDTVRLVNRVLDLSKLEARKMALSCVRFEPQAWLESVLVEDCWKARHKRIEMVGVVDVNVPVVLEMDTMRLTQALKELIENAIQCTKSGHALVRLSVCSASITLESALEHLNAADAPLQPAPPPPPPSLLSCITRPPTHLVRFTSALFTPCQEGPFSDQSTESEELSAWGDAEAAAAVLGESESVRGRREEEGEGGSSQAGSQGDCEGGSGGSGCGERMQLVVSCEDTGCGIDEAKHGELFEFKGRSESGGAGLGLVLTHHLASLMGGRIACLSHPGIGSTFAFSIPFTAPPSAPHTSAASAARPRTAGLEGVAVGVVGSDACRMELTARMLSGLGAQVHLLPILSSKTQGGREGGEGERGREGEGEGGMGEKVKMREGMIESIPRVVVVEEGDIWRQQSQEGGEVACSGACDSNGTGQQCEGNRLWRGHGGGMRMGGVALVPAGAAAWAAAVQVVRRVEGMTCGGQVAGVVVLAGCCSGEEMVGEGEEEEEEEEGDSPFTAATACGASSPRVIICRRLLLSHHLHHAVQPLIPVSVTQQHLDSTPAEAVRGRAARPIAAEPVSDTAAVSLSLDWTRKSAEKGAEKGVWKSIIPPRVGVWRAGVGSSRAAASGMLPGSQKSDGMVSTSNGEARQGVIAHGDASNGDLNGRSLRLMAAKGVDGLSAAADDTSISRSSSSRSSSFRSSKQAAAAPLAGAAVCSVAANAGANAVLQGLGVLVVDDTSVNLVVARRTLSRCGAAVATAGSGEDAVRHVKEAMGGAGEALDVVLMDLQMPGMDGFMATEAIRTHEKAAALQVASTSAAVSASASASASEATIGVIEIGGTGMEAAICAAAPPVSAVPRVPIVALTADVDEEITRRCLANGFDGILQKPVDPKLLSHLLLRINYSRPYQKENHLN